MFSLLLVFIFYARASVYFTFSTIAVSLHLSHDLRVRLRFVTCCPINILNTQYNSGRWRDGAAGATTTDDCNKKLRYYRRTARRAMPVEIYLYLYLSDDGPISLPELVQSVLELIHGRDIHNILR